MPYVTHDNSLLTKHEGHSGEYWPDVIAVWNKLHLNFLFEFFIKTFLFKFSGFQKQKYMETVPIKKILTQ